MEKVTLFIPKSLMKELRELKKKDGIPVSESIRRAIKNYLSAKNE